MEKENNKNVFVKMEEEVLKFWKDNDTFEKSVAKDAPKGEYVFYDGPPFATGTPHYGHLVASLMKDAVPRYWTMNGYKVERVWGWDCHGLPIENIVEKELGSESKKNIEENIGVEKFNELCRSKVLTYVEDWKKTVTRLGRWVDMENAYKTMDLPFMESVWWVFKQLWDKGLIYKDYRSMHVCPRCETTLSQSEVAEGYKDIKDLSVTAKFHLRAGQKWGNGKYETKNSAYVLAWTTTPWTLPGNVALAVGNDIKYTALRIKDVSELLIVASERISNVFKDKEIEIVHEDILGSDLVGLEYEPLFDAYANDEKLENRERGWKIYAADFVTTTDGTGVVHIAPAFGEDDMKLGRAEKLPFIQHVAMDGHFKPEMGALAGLHVKPKNDVQSTDVEIIKYLAGKGLLFSKEKYEHSYPHCWRCDTPLINYATSSWFVKISDIKPKALETAKDIAWFPENIKEGRFGNWLEGARDWSISRQRFWASCMPIWECKCGERVVFGSVEELNQASGQKVEDLHKHILDKIVFPCDKCGGEMKRVSDVLDTWFDSGSMPYAQMHYPFENKEKFERNFPAKFIAEGLDQTRCWFYYLHAIANGIKDSRAYDNVIVNGIVLAEDGKKMSKKLKNYPDPVLLLEKHGADALRYYLLTSPVMSAENLNFSEKGVIENLRKVNMLLWNVYKFYEMYANPNIQYPISNIQLENVLDKWIVARLNQLIAEVSDGMAKYDLSRTTRPIALFIDDLSTWYLRRSRDRFKEEGDDKQAALATTKYVLETLAKVMAPFTPFIAEQLWQKVTGYNFDNTERSVHLENWPIPEKDWSKEIFIDVELLEKMKRIRKIVEISLAERDKAGIKVRQVLGSLKVESLKLNEDFVNLIKDEVNVKEVVFVERVGEIKVFLDTELTPELIAEGVSREMIRFINAMRKNNDLTIGDRISVYFKAKGDIKNAILTHKEQIMKETLADSLEEGESDIGNEVKINNDSLTLSIIKKNN